MNPILLDRALRYASEHRVVHGLLSTKDIQAAALDCRVNYRELLARAVELGYEVRP